MKREIKVVNRMKTITSVMTFVILFLGSLALTSCFISGGNNNGGNDNGDEGESVVIANFEANITVVQGRATVELINNSENATSYEWSFPGGSPLSSTAENPSVIYNENGTYTITLEGFNDTTSASSVQDIVISGI